MEKRDLKRDLKLCEKAMPGKWTYDSSVSYKVVRTTHREYWYKSAGAKKDSIVLRMNGELGQTQVEPTAEFIAESREGWPEAIERAIEAEAKLTKIQRILKEPAPFGALDVQLDQIREVVADEN